MKKTNLLLIISSLFLTSCNNINNEISLNDIFKIKDESYTIYIYSTACPSCESLSTKLNDYLATSPASFYTINLFNEDSDTYNKMHITTNENEVELSIGATKLEEIYFLKAPCIYFINKKEGKPYLASLLSSYSDIELFFTNNVA